MANKIGKSGICNLAGVGAGVEVTAGDGVGRGAGVGVFRGSDADVTGEGTGKVIAGVFAGEALMNVVGEGI